MKLLALIGVVALAATWPLVASADDAADREAMILTRVLAYDRNLKTRVDGTVTIVVLSMGSQSADTDKSYTRFRALERLTIHGLPLKVVRLEYTGIASLKAQLDRTQAAALYLGPGLDAELSAILAEARGHSTLTMASDAAYLAGGASVGVFMSAGAAKLHINLTASRQEGAFLLPELLSLAKVTR